MGSTKNNGKLPTIRVGISGEEFEQIRHAVKTTYPKEHHLVHTIDEAYKAWISNRELENFSLMIKQIGAEDIGKTKDKWFSSVPVIIKESMKYHNITATRNQSNYIAKRIWNSMFKKFTEEK